MTFFDVTLTISLVICALGLLYRLVSWFRLSVARPAPPLRDRIFGALAGLGDTVSRGRLGVVLLRGVKDSLLQLDNLQRSPFRWTAHALLFVGFMGLVVMHAMQGVVSYNYFPGYEPTLDPYQWLRNLFGAMALAGVAMAAARRKWSRAGRSVRTVTKREDWFVLALIGAIMVTGFGLEAVKITSADVFQRMVDTYYPAPPEEELVALQSFWAEEYGTIFSEAPPRDPETLELGAEVDDFACASCHSRTTSAFVSYPMAKVISPAAPALDFLNTDVILWYVHVLLCFFGLAWLPFGKMLHVATTPLQLTLRPRTTEPAPAAPSAGPAPAPSADPGGQAVQRVIGLQACTHCGVCSEHCSVLPVYQVLGNEDILPSEKLRSLADAATEKADGPAMARFAEGSFICTECNRCTELCPSHIDLQDLWLTSKRDLIDRELAEPHGWIIRRDAAQWAEYFRKHTVQTANTIDRSRAVNLTDRKESFWACIQCTTCTSVCPVVAAAEDPMEELDLAPQQIMNVLRMGRKDLALGSRMVWNCVTCYKCQENCPQGIKVADILYELRNIAARELRPEPDPTTPGRPAKGKGGDS